MKLLVITQAVDKSDPVLGFFHRWLDEFSRQCSTLTVICLKKGNYDLPSDVKIFSLGKEAGGSRLVYIWRFYRYLWLNRKNYEAVFVHMNQEYVLLAGWWWRLTGKKVLFWRNHPLGNIFTRVAILFSNKVFCTSNFSFTARYPKTHIMPAGIDTDYFQPDQSISRTPRSILFLGRISPIKKPEILVKALAEMRLSGEIFHCSFIGGPGPKDRVFYNDLEKRVLAEGLGEAVSFLPAITNEETKQVYCRHKIFVNLTPTGSLDKTIFEAMACGCLVVVSNNSLADLRSIENHLLCRENDHLSLAQDLKYFLNLDEGLINKVRHQLIDYTKIHHGLKGLVLKILSEANA